MRARPTRPREYEHVAAITINNVAHFVFLLRWLLFSNKNKLFACGHNNGKWNCHVITRIFYRSNFECMSWAHWQEDNTFIYVFNLLIAYFRKNKRSLSLPVPHNQFRLWIFTRFYCSICINYRFSNGTISHRASISTDESPRKSIYLWSCFHFDEKMLINPAIVFCVQDALVHQLEINFTLGKFLFDFWMNISKLSKPCVHFDSEWKNAWSRFTIEFRNQFREYNCWSLSTTAMIFIFIQ